MRIAIIAALPGELKPLVANRFWTKAPAKLKAARKWTASFNNGDEWIAVCAGMGADAARRAFAEAEDGGKLDMVLSIGWAGALKPSFRAGDVYVPSVVVDAQTGERFSLTNGKRKLVLVTTARVADGAAKRRLAASYDGALVDMESAAVVRMAEARGIPVCCMKAVSDPFDAKLPDFNPFIDAMGQLNMLRFVLHVALRPRYWAVLASLGSSSRRAAEMLASKVLVFLETKDCQGVNRSGLVRGFEESTRI